MTEISCKNCTAASGRSVMRKGHKLADKHGWVSLCEILKEEGVCQLMLVSRLLDIREKELRQRQITVQSRE